ncbi:hypothetical protein RSAG8_06398, partial [Rhizoctonia solani AG-8 WAC10335]
MFPNLSNNAENDCEYRPYRGTNQTPTAIGLDGHFHNILLFHRYRSHAPARSSLGSRTSDDGLKVRKEE